ncbi:uncharacterized protein LOC107042338 [Diachasma alloeum]|uniref:uncharacterized protein LOC107042338 n=1 Tax=Diachasma alloeum TaxID=454923 RepID=UPI000738367C|nr:uncharacterized protein LOC107042338 [Diachasma alloeum]
MAWKQLHIGQLLESIGYVISLDFVKKLTRNTLNFVGGWMGRVARAKREVITKRLRRRRKKLEACKMGKRGPCKCSCVKCSSYRYVQRKRVLEPDYLANLAYQQRICQDDVSPDGENVPESPRTPPEMRKPREDHRDLQQSDYDGVVWWTDVNHRVLMPPLLNDLPTRSNYSSTSGFRSASPDILESSETTINTSDSSDSSDYQSCWEDSSSPRTIKMSSKSEPRVRNIRTERSRVTRTSRSASMPLGHPPNHQDTSQLASDPTETPSRRKKRPVSSKTTTSHVCDTFSTCVKCSNTASRPSKRVTR